MCKATTWRKSWVNTTLAFSGTEYIPQTHSSQSADPERVEIYEVKEMLGHADLKTTMRYAHLERTDISLKAKQVLDQLNSTTSDTGIDTTFGMDSSP